MKLSPDQHAAITAVRDHPPSPHEPFLLTGNAGMGKTTIAHKAVTTLGYQPHEVLYVAESNKAVTVLRSKLPAGSLAATVCSAAFRFNVEKKQALDEIEQRLSAPKLAPYERYSLIEQRRLTQEQADRIPTHRWTHPLLDPDTPPALVVLDEGSMINNHTRDYLDSLGVPMLVIGDWAQLPPIDGEPGYDFRRASQATLTTCHRTDVPALVKLWDRARALVTAPENDPLPKHGWISQRGPLRDLLDADVVVTGRRVTHAALTYALRTLQNRPLHVPTAGDVLMASENALGITKGDFRTVAAVRRVQLQSRNEKRTQKRTTVCFMIKFTDGTEHLVETYGFYRPWLKPEQVATYAPSLINIPDVYAARRLNPPPLSVTPSAAPPLTSWEYGRVITCHKAQGSQWSSVAVIDESMCWYGSGQHGQWIYTAVSRAEKKVRVYGPPRRNSDIFHFADHSVDLVV